MRTSRGGRPPVSNLLFLWARSPWWIFTVTVTPA